MATSQRVKEGERFHVMLPWSEAAIHLRVADQVLPAEIVPGRRMVQLYREDGSPFSFPITTGEAGVYEDETGFYIHDPANRPW